jgi:6-phosphogluconolactonase
MLEETLLDWSRVDFFWGDERAVGPDHPDSNYGLARRLLLERITVDPGRVHRIPAESGELSQAADEYAATLLRALGDPPRLDLALLGVGPDGHVCSLFPAHPLLDDETRWVAPVFDSPKPPPSRITLTLRTLAAADVVGVAAFGEAKAEVVRAALEDEASPLPLARVTRAAKSAVFLVDFDWAGSARKGAR